MADLVSFGDILLIMLPTPRTSWARVDPGSKKATGPTIFNYSHHSLATREIPLRGLELELEENPKAEPMLLRILLAVLQSASFFVLRRGNKELTSHFSVLLCRVGPQPLLRKT